jgi:hypothetical protein
MTLIYIGLIQTSVFFIIYHDKYVMFEITVYIWSYHHKGFKIVGLNVIHWSYRNALQCLEFDGANGACNFM